MFTTIQTAAMMKAAQDFAELYGVTPTLITREDSIEMSFDDDGKHLGLIELRVWRDWNDGLAPIAKVTLQSLKLIPSENRYEEIQCVAWR